MNITNIEKQRKTSVAALEHELEVFTAYLTDLSGYKSANGTSRQPKAKLHPYYEIVRDLGNTWVSLVEYKPKYPSCRDDLKSQIEDQLRHLAVWSDRSTECRLSYVIKFERCKAKGKGTNTPELYDRAFLLLAEKELTRGSRNKLTPQDITDYLQIHYDFGAAEGKVIEPESKDPLPEFLQISPKQQVSDFYFSRWLMTEMKVWAILRNQFPGDDDQANSIRLIIKYDNHVAQLGREASMALMKHRNKALQRMRGGTGENGNQRQSKQTSAHKNSKE